MSRWSQRSLAPPTKYPRDMAEEEAKHETSRVGKIFAIDIEISVAKTDSGSKKKTDFAHHNFVKWSFQPYDKLVVF
jgi:hypothetical protein